MEIATRKFTIRNTKDRLKIYFLGDIHEGNANSDTKALRKAVDIIKQNNGYWIGMGDYIDCIVNSQDPRFDPVEISEKYKIRDLKNLPKKQMDAVIDNLEPIQDRCIALIVGNHEEAYIKRHSFDVYDYLATKVNAPKLGYVGDVVLSINSPQRSAGIVRLALNHGDGGGGKREGYPINKVHDVFRWRIADVSVMGHIHKLAVDRENFIMANQRGTAYKEISRWYGCSGCFLRTYEKGNRNYYEHKGKPASDIGMLRLDISLTYDKQIILSLHKIYL